MRKAWKVFGKKNEKVPISGMNTSLIPTNAGSADPSIPDRTTPLLGWRVWAATDDPVVPLASVTRQDVKWVPYQRLEARCGGSWMGGVNCGGGGDHTCGIHGAQNLESALPYWQSADHVLGRVRLWGRVTIHGNGIMRAEFAYPDTFVYSTRGPWKCQALAEWLARIYGVDVLAMNIQQPWSTVVPWQNPYFVVPSAPPNGTPAMPYPVQNPWVQPQAQPPWVVQQTQTYPTTTAGTDQTLFGVSLGNIAWKVAGGGI